MMKMLVMLMTKMSVMNCDKVVGDVDEEDVGDVYDYVLMSLPLFRVISVTRTILGRNHFHTEGRQTHTERHHYSCFAMGHISFNSQATYF